MADALDEKRTVPSFVVVGDEVSEGRKRRLMRGVYDAGQAGAGPGGAAGAATQERRGGMPVKIDAPWDGVSDNVYECMDEKALKRALKEASEALPKVTEEGASAEAEMGRLLKDREEVLWLLGEVGRIDHEQRHISTMHKVEVQVDAFNTSAREQGWEP